MSLRFSEEWLKERLEKEKAAGHVRTHTLDGDNPKRQAAQTKYKNKRVWTEEWGWFDSQAELKRWRELLLLQEAGKIQELERQVTFILAPRYKFGKRWRPPLRFKADFVYLEAGQKVVEDKKGDRTRPYIIKRHLMATVHGILIRET